VNDNLPTDRPDHGDAWRELHADLDLLRGALDTWSGVQPDSGPAEVTRAGHDALVAIDAMLAGLRELRSELVDEIRQHQDADNARTDALLERLRRERGITPLPDNGADTRWQDPGTGPGHDPKETP
jgi:hypothetical protein